MTNQGSTNGLWSTDHVRLMLDTWTGQGAVLGPSVAPGGVSLGLK